MKMLQEQVCEPDVWTINATLRTCGGSRQIKTIESAWWDFSQLYEKGLVYRGFKVMPYSTECRTPLSNFEANANYKDVPDPEIMASFPIVGNAHNASLVAWTTTPWTLPSNLCLCVNANLNYAKVLDFGELG